jgi:hypothetical protein
LQVLQQDASNPEFNEQQAAGAIQTVENAPRLIFSALNVLDLSPGGTKALGSSSKGSTDKGSTDKGSTGKGTIGKGTTGSGTIGKGTIGKGNRQRRNRRRQLLKTRMKTLVAISDPDVLTVSTAAVFARRWSLVKDWPHYLPNLKPAGNLGFWDPFGRMEMQDVQHYLKSYPAPEFSVARDFEISQITVVIKILISCQESGPHDTMDWKGWCNCYLRRH